MILKRSRWFKSILSYFVDLSEFLNTDMKTLTFGVAHCDLINEAHKPAYNAWHRMLTRCYSEKYQRLHPTYQKCEVCEEWLTYSNFKKWFVDNYIEGYQLDKDILVKGNKIYSPDFCTFIPQHINSLLIDRSNDRGKYPLGVNYEPKFDRYKSCISIHGKVKHLGYFKDPDTAHLAWAEAKKKYVSECANASYNCGEISKEVRDALLSRTFE